MESTKTDIQQIIDMGFNYREKWSEVPEKIQEEVRRVITVALYEKAMTYHNDIERYYFILGVLHGIWAKSEF